jgi:hypothetical protein
MGHGRHRSHRVRRHDVGHRKAARDGHALRDLVDTSVEVWWVIYEYDPLAKQYYVAFSNSGQGAADAKGAKGVEALIKKEGGELKLTISPNPGE